METIILPRVENERSLTRLVAFLSALPRKKAWRIRIDELKGDRTTRQNGALFGVAYPPLCEHIGCYAEQFHIAMCKRYFGAKDILGDEVPIRTTTRDENGNRDVIQWDTFSKFYEMVQQIGAELKTPIWVPDPDKHLRTR